MKNKTVLITGASAGIGKATALAFAGEKYNVILTYNKEGSEAAGCAKKCLALGAPEVLVIKLDVKDNKSIKAAVRKSVKRFSKIDVLVNNAGVLVYDLLSRQTPADIEHVLRTNLEGLIKMTLESLPYVKSTIVNISSYYGLHVDPKVSVYCASKFGVRGFSQALAKEIRQKVFVVNPAGTATQMNDWKGAPPRKVARIIVGAANGKHRIKSGGDINV